MGTCGPAPTDRGGSRPGRREHLRGGLRAGVAIYAAIRDVAVALFAMSELDPDSVGGAIGATREATFGGIEHLAQRLADQDVLRRTSPSPRQPT